MKRTVQGGLIALALVGCSDERADGPDATAPLVRIETPSDGTVEDVGSELTFTASVWDEATSPDGLLVEWSSDVDGELLLSRADASGRAAFGTTELTRGPHTITARVTDTDQLSAEDAVEIVVNGPPTAPVISLLPEGSTTADALEIRIDTPSDDLDGDTVSLRYDWSADGTPYQDLTQATVPAERTSRDQTWTVRATPNDGRLDGPSAEASVTIGNAPPQVTSVVLSDTSPRTNDTLSATVEAEDPDLDDITYAYDWTVNGTPVDTTGSSLDGFTSFDKGDRIVLTITPHDPFSSGAPQASSTATVENTEPEPPMTRVSSQLGGRDDVTCQIDEDAVDADGDTLTYTLAWEADGAAYPTDFIDATGPSTDALTDDTVPLADHGLADEWACSIVASDGTDTSEAAESSFYVWTTPVEYGNSSRFGYNDNHDGEELRAQQITLDRDMVITDFYVITTFDSGSSGRMGLYSESGGSLTLVVGSPLQRVHDGTTRFPVAPTHVEAGTYWIAGVYSGLTYVAEDQTRTLPSRWTLSTSATGPLPTAPYTFSGSDHPKNYSVRGFE